MDDNDDFELINEPGLATEQTFEFVDAVDITVQKNSVTKLPATSNVAESSVISKPTVNEIPQVVQQQKPNLCVNTSESTITHPLIMTITPTTPIVTIKKTTPPPPPPPTENILIPVPQLPKAPAPQRWGDAALIPHNLDETIDIEGIKSTTRKNLEHALNMSSKQQIDIQAILEQRRMASGSAFSNVLKAKEDLQKSPEQLEQEKRSILAQRVPQLDLNGKTKEDLIEKAKQFHNLLHQLHGAIYELTERFERQKYDMVELTERARQIEKGKAKTRKSNIVHTGLGGGLFTGVNDITSQAPPKVSLFSRYERLTDRRTFKDRRDVWAIEKNSKDFVPERPKAKIRPVAGNTESGPVRKAKLAAKQAEAETKHEESTPPPEESAPEPEPEPVAEEEPAAEEPAAEEEPAEEEHHEEPAAEEEEEE